MTLTQQFKKTTANKPSVKPLVMPEGWNGL
jgi:hypothetical protein